MRSFAINRITAAALVAATTLLCTTVAAGELLVLPYACRVVGGEPVLTPAPDQGYRVIGRREERDFTECSPANPDMCRRWKLYRFDVDCGGQRLPWVSLSAAADTHNGGRSWVEDGRMHLEMPPSWSLRPDDPCAREARYGWRAGRHGRYCAERRNMERANVEMPAGFAPMLELDAIFVADKGPAPAPQTAAAPVVAERPVPKPIRAEAPAPAREPEKPVKAPAAPPVAKSAPVPAPSELAKPDGTPPTATDPATETATGTPLTPTIINQPGLPSAKAAPEQVAIAPPETTAALAEAKVPPAVVAESDTRQEPHADPAPPVEESKSKPIAVTLVDDLTKSVSPALLGVGGVTMLGLLALLFAYRRHQTEPAFTLARDIAAVSFDGRAGGKELVRAGRSLATSAPEGATPQSPAPQRGGAPANWGDAIPQTREEALQVLGMGVAPEVSEIAVKKIVDGLRLSWHPDYATSPEDRELRELRMKQINAAWDVIGGKRAP
ncbi:hypothetical protein GIW81_08795 [Hyphomicrobium sp. xq]|uniref:J domain-containing protein n=1 Tax=Hyphomicrobium album TaxID=2665159 RepID=A0A6I3KKH0_9HYPH|nr:J domain-containing protein [Hyphomicrobium album]MTD94430.1 hypothetical protein [Hyphomicrobium album]